jgi:hypothetical protein
MQAPSKLDRPISAMAVVGRHLMTLERPAAFVEATARSPLFARLACAANARRRGETSKNGCQTLARTRVLAGRRRAVNTSAQRAPA